MKALDESIKKWENIVAGTGIDKLSENCALCKEFEGPFNCGGCPVTTKSGSRGCSDTPYEKWNIHQIQKHRPFQTERKVYCSECREFAKEELDFLKSLKKSKYYLKITNPEDAIGENYINIIVVDEFGNEIHFGDLVRITLDGKLELSAYFSMGEQLDTGISVDEDFKIKIENA